MAKVEKTGGFWQSMLAVNFYKRNQGKVVRALTAAAILAAILVGAWAFSVTFLGDAEPAVQYGVPVAIALVGAWFAFRIVNFPVFADFLADVEAEMVKVSWPAKDEVRRATAVVLVTMFIFSFVLFMYDVIWQQLLRWIGVLRF
ncbi:MAG TPA: preprotein translocase subunit SecE [Planctomycetaceae bacterium]|nr:preprotein translocase subunit SecE [Planctomycetaceae bacterium]